MTLENLLVLVAVLVAGFINIVLPLLKKASRQAQQAPQPGQDQPTDLTPEAQAPAPLRELARPQHMPFAAALKRLPAGRTEPGFEPQRRRRPLGGLAEVRRGMVLRTVLGPCRAQQPFDARGDWT